MSSPLWTADIEVTLPLAVQLVAQQFPMLKGLPVNKVNEGWDNVIFHVGDEWYFRFPRRKIALQALETEISHLPRLALLLPLPIPIPEHIGKPSALFPYPFYGYRPVHGVEGCDLQLSPAQRKATTKELARFLKKLHSPEVYALLKEGLNLDPVGRLDFSKRYDLGMKKLLVLENLKEDLDYSILRKALDDACSARITKYSIVHGDLYFRHIIFSPKGHLTGVIDWGDMQINDPAVDFQIYWSFFPKEARQDFESEYGIISDDQKTLSRGVAVFLNATLLEYALHEKLENVVWEARTALKLTSIA